MKLLIAGGGTGGHLYSGIAVAQEWQARGGEVVFAGTERGLEKTLIPKYGFPLELISVGALKGKGIGHKLKTLGGLPMALMKSFFLLKKVKPEVVLGIGGYASGPVLLVASLRSMPTAILDQNSVPGMTNRILGKWVKKIFLNFEAASSFFPGRAVRVVGNPVIKSRRGPGPKGASEGGSLGDKREPKEGVTLLVCGGSQGAHVLNEKFLEAILSVKKEFPGVCVIHQTGPADAALADEKLKKGGVPAIVAPFFHDMEKHYGAATLVIARAGAGTLTELAAYACPSILVPYPFAADGHQLKNAEVFAKAGAAKILEQKNLTGEILASEIMALLKDPEKLNGMAEKALSLHKPNAAKDVVDGLMNV